MKKLAFNICLLTSLNLFAQSAVDENWIKSGCENAASALPSLMTCKELNLAALNIIGTSSDNARINLINSLNGKLNAGITGIELINVNFSKLLRNTRTPVANSSAQTLLKVYKSGTEYLKRESAQSIRCLGIVLNEMDYRQAEKNQCL